MKITETELHVVSRTARAGGYRRVILVTSLEHTPRVKLLWTRETHGRTQAIAVAARDDPFPIDDGWRQRRVAEKVLHKYLGLRAIYLGVSRLMS